MAAGIQQPLLGPLPGQVAGNHFRDDRNLQMNGRIVGIARRERQFYQGQNLNCVDDLKLHVYKFAVGLSYIAVMGIALALCALVGLATFHNPVLFAASVAIVFPLLIAAVGSALTLTANFLLEKLRTLLHVDRIFRHTVFSEFYPHQPLAPMLQ